MIEMLLALLVKAGIKVKICNYCAKEIPQESMHILKGYLSVTSVCSVERNNEKKH